MPAPSRNGSSVEPSSQNTRQNSAKPIAPELQLLPGAHRHAGPDRSRWRPTRHRSGGITVLAAPRAERVPRHGPPDRPEPRDGVDQTNCSRISRSSSPWPGSNRMRWAMSARSRPRSAPASRTSVEFGDRRDRPLVRRRAPRSSTRAAFGSSAPRQRRGRNAAIGVSARMSDADRQDRPVRRVVVGGRPRRRRTAAPRRRPARPSARARRRGCAASPPAARRAASRPR